jgi:RNA polymerase sigma-70 factor (ECF subfamily)
MSSSFPVARFPDLPLSQEKAAASPISADTSQAPIEIHDESLLAQISTGDQEALAVLFRRYARLVWSIAERILRDSAEAEDLMQEVFLSIHRRASAFDGSKGSARNMIVHMTWQLAFTRRTYLDARHSAYAFGLGKDVTEADTATSFSYDESIEAHLGREGLQRALAEMSEDQRETLRLFFFEGYTMGEIAEKLGQSRGNVKHHYYRGLDRLRKHMPGNETSE